MTPDGLDQIARAVLTAVAGSAWRALALAGVMGLAFVILRRKSAAVRLTAWTLVLYAALALPLVALLVPAWRVQVPALRFLTDWPSASIAPLASAANLSMTGDGSTTVEAAGFAFAVSGPVIAAAIYLSGVLLLALHASVAWLVSRRLRRSAAPITDAGALATLARYSAAAGSGRPPLLAESPHLFVPVTMSVARPIVALPADWRDWPAGRLDAVLAHEAAHVARGDALTQRVSLAYRALFWCSPLSWWLHRHLSELAEQASDEAALQSGIEPTAYAETLVGFFARLQRGPRRAHWHVAMARGADRDAANRVERILSWKECPIMTRSTWLLAGMVLAAAPVVALTASIRPTPAPTPPLVMPVPPGTSPQEIAAPLSAPAVSAADAATTRGRSPSQSVRPAGAPTPARAPGGATATTEPGRDQDPQTPAGQQTAAQLADEEFAKGAYEVGAPGVVAPRALLTPHPKYTSAAMRAKIQGIVNVELIVMPDGTVGKSRVTQSLDMVWGLDEQALIAARQWTFVPGTLDGQPVPVRVTVMMEFRLH